MNFKKGRYSKFINPFLIGLDSLIIFLIIIHFNNISENVYFTKSLYPKLPNNTIFIIYSLLLWYILSFYIKFYKIYRYTKTEKLISIIVKQAFFYLFFILAFFGFLKIEVPRKITFLYVLIIFCIIGTIKLIIFFVLKKYRYYFGGNIRTVIIIGNTEAVKQLISFFKQNKELGYQIKGIFGNNTKLNHSGNIKKAFKYINLNQIDEIYCSLDSLENWEINKFIELADKNHSNIKFIPTHNSINKDKVDTDFYGILPVLSLKEPALNNSVNQFIKRSFDVFFSLFVLIFILSWLVPIMFILIKLESKGPVFYKHYRYGLNYNKFYCYKFRSLKTDNTNVLDQVKKEDNRLTKIGKFIRKTSIDEIPQFINVLKGEMSVVGPRPHMIPYANLYAKHFDKYKYMYRHSVKPGITGLAQIKGYRGKTEKNEDIINRIKYDVFYIENWSFIQDINIIIQTIINFVKGDEKAY